MVRSIYLKTLRDYRIGILGWGLGWGALIAAIYSTVPALVSTPGARAALIALGPSFAWFAEPIKIDTSGGYATWKYGLTVLVVALWPMLAESRFIRGEEERGSIDVLLSVPRARARVALEKVAAMWSALALMALLIGVLAFGGARKAGVDASFVSTLLFGLNMALIAAFFGAVALLISQFTQERRTAAGLTAGLLLVFAVMDMAHRVISGTEWISRLSPVYYYNLSKPLIPGYGADAGGMLLLLALSLVLTGAAIWLFARRDVGGVVSGPAFLRLPERPAKPAVLPVNHWSLGSVYRRGLAMVAVPAFWWTLAIAGFGAWFVLIAKQTAAQLAALMQSQLGSALIKSTGSNLVNAQTILSLLFIFLPVMLMAFSVTQASKWAGDEEDGRLEIVLSTPQPRLAVILGQFAALSTATVAITLVTFGATAAIAALAGVSVDGGRLAEATLTMLPLGLLVAALGYLFSGWLRTAVDTGLLSFLLVIWFVISFIGPGLNWPDATLKLSALYYYGNPLLRGVELGNLAVLVGAGAIALILAGLRFSLKDIAI
ncbi:MAG TPA: ABC transporter permease subunit [Candidatus Dormibacteraeota bacterium]|nr:ABC transporter permease subunit [Candidatus Dormibacteraeota bacterium]